MSIPHTRNLASRKSCLVGASLPADIDVGEGLGQEVRAFAELGLRLAHVL